MIDGLEADVVTLAMWADTERDRQGRLDQGRLARTAAERLAAVLVDDRVRRPQRKPQGDQGLARPGSRRRGSHHAQSQDLGQRQAELPRRPGAALSCAADPRTRPRSSSPSCIKHVPVLDSGARAATTTFAQKEIGDVHLTWENEAHFEVQEAEGELEIVYPADQHSRRAARGGGRRERRRKKTRDAAEAYLKFLYTPEAQEIIAKNYYRPFKPKSCASIRSRSDRSSCSRSSRSPTIGKSRERFFAEGGVFDQIYANAKQ